MTSYLTNPRCLLTSLPDGTGVVLHLDDKFYFTLNATAVFMWQRIADGSARTVPALAEAIALAFRVDVAAARGDVQTLLDELVANGLSLKDAA